MTVDGSDTPSSAIRARRPGDHDAAIEMLVEETRQTRKELRQGLADIQMRLAKGDTAIALLEERHGSQGRLISSLTVRFDELERMTRALACDDCEARIDRLEDAEKARAAVDAESTRRRAWQPPWWLMLLLTIIAGVVTAFGSKMIGAGP